MKIDRDRIEYIIRIIKSTAHDKLREFAAVPLVEELADMQKQNLNNVFLLCEELGIRYIHISSDEICGCENIEYNNWPAVWRICRVLGISFCGNQDQQQYATGQWFPDNMFGGYDLKEHRALSNDEIQSLKFNFVVRR